MCMGSDLFRLQMVVVVGGWAGKIKLSAFFLYSYAEELSVQSLQQQCAHIVEM